MRQKLIPVLCNVGGTLILLLVIAICLPMAMPRFLDYQVYHVVSGSMEPEIPVGSLVFVKETPPEEIPEGEIIAFRSGGSVTVHRAVQNKVVEGEFVTKGDANSDADPASVSYRQVIGLVVTHVPVLGQILSLCSNTVGKIYLLLLAACGAMLNMLAGRLRRYYLEQEK